MQIIRFSRSLCTLGKVIRSKAGDDETDEVEEDDDDDDADAGEW